MEWDYDRVKLTWFLELVDVYKKNKPEIWENKHIFWKKLNKKQPTQQHRVEKWSGLFVRKKKSKTPEVFLACDGISRTCEGV